MGARAPGRPTEARGSAVATERCGHGALQEWAGDQLERRCNAPLLYALTHAATEEFNALAEEFEENDSELETAAREAIAEDFEWIAKAYGFDADIEELIAPRDW